MDKKLRDVTARILDLRSKEDPIWKNVLDFAIETVENVAHYIFIPSEHEAKDFSSGTAFKVDEQNIDIVNKAITSWNTFVSKLPARYASDAEEVFRLMLIGVVRSRSNNNEPQ